MTTDLFVSIISKPLNKATTRLQRMLLRLQRYDPVLLYLNLVDNFTVQIHSREHTLLQPEKMIKTLFCPYSNYIQQLQLQSNLSI